MRLRDLVESSALGVTAVAATGGLDRELESVMVTDLPDPSRYLRGGELVVSGLMWLSDPRRSPAEHCELFVGAVARAGCAGLAAGDTTDAPLPRELLDSCARYGVPLLHVPAQLAFADLGDWISRRISAHRAGDAGELLARHRRLVAAEAQQGLSAVVRLIGQETGMACCVLTAAGEPVAAHGEMPTLAARTVIVRDALRTAMQQERLVEHRGRAYSVYTVHGRPGTPITDWYAAFEGDWRTWPRQRREAARGAARLIGAERSRLAEGRRALRRVGRDLVTMAAGGAPAAEIGARLSVAGLDPAAGMRAVAVAVGGAPPGEAPGAGALLVGRLARMLVEEATARVPVPVAVFERGGADSAAAAGQERDGDFGGPGEGVPFAVAVCAQPAEQSGDEPATSDADVVRARLTALYPGLGRPRAAVGLSGRCTQPADLAGAIEEARLALRVALHRSGRVEVADHDELATHLVLLAHVPDELRRGYRDRLLGPLRAYDARHHSRLEETLDRFLGCSGSWSRCAQELHIHVNTLRYRIEKINQLTGRDLSRLDHQVDFYLALRAR
jgi:hypothetical protein